MEDQTQKKTKETEVTVEYIPGRRNHFYYARTRPISPLGLAVLAAAGLLALSLILVIGSFILILAVGGGLLYAAWRRLSGRRW